VTAARRARVAEMAAAGLSDAAIAETLGVHKRTVLRDRQHDQIPSRYFELFEPSEMLHGEAGYTRGCRCDACRQGHREAHRAYMLQTGRRLGSYAPCARCGRRVYLVDGVAYAGNGTIGAWHVCRPGRPWRDVPLFDGIDA